MGRNFCTFAGMQTAQAEYAKLKKTACNAPIPATGRNSLRESEIGEFHDLMQEQAINHGLLQALAHFMGEHQPIRQEQCEKAYVGNLVTIVYPDAAGLEVSKSFVLGGENEPQIYREQGIDILNYQADFGKLFLGKEVGDEVTVKLNGVRVKAEIEKIALPPEPDSATTFAPMQTANAA